ncbi:MAG: hypothetical protein HKN23_05170 [Verrucomicrobiales bacterium]|nr:hypothetical protein [Verrucomicrobiales bacterium]
MKRLILAAVLLTVFPIGMRAQAPLKSGQIAAGTKWATPYYVNDSGKEGPTILITGGVHGNEPAGALAADQIRHWPLESGRLVVIPRANKRALSVRHRRTPEAPRELGDLNRSFPKTGEPDKAKTELAQALWDFIKQVKPDWVLDLHEGFAIHRQNPESVGSTILCTADEETAPVFENALEAVNASIEDSTRHFLLKKNSPTVNGGLVRASIERLGAKGAVLETTYNGIPFAVRIRQHRVMVNRILQDLKVTSAGPDDLVFRSERDSSIWVAIYHDRGVGGNGPRAMRTEFSAMPGIESRTIGSAEVRNGVLKQFDAVIFPGGSGSKQAAGLGGKGREQVRKFVSEGGGFVGICAGCYLACENFSWSLKILDAKTRSSKWRRGRAELELGFENGGEDLFGLDSEIATVIYQNGPVMERAGSSDIPDFETLARFKTEVAKNETPKGLQVGTPAILRGQFGKGRVVGISPHPEQTEGLRHLVPELVKWTVNR